MDPALRTYIDSVREICSQRWSLSAKVDRIEEKARALIAKPLQLEGELRYIPPVGYGRNLIHRDPDHGFVVIAMVWPPNAQGCAGSPHDHGTWGVVAVSEGTVKLTTWQREDDGSDKTKAMLRQTSCVDGKPGDISHVLPPHEDIHSVWNASTDRPALSIHTYGRDMKRCRVFDERSGSIAFADLSYHNEAGTPSSVVPQRLGT